MKIKNIQYISCFLAILFPRMLCADEGLWLVHLLEQKLVQQLQTAGLRIDTRVIYDASAPSVSDAILSLDTEGTGSVISEQGLVLTSYFNLQKDIALLPQYIREDGFCALHQDSEIPLKGRSAYFLRKVLDVTDEMQNRYRALPASSDLSVEVRWQRATENLEADYRQHDGITVTCLAMWGGSRYYLFFYEKYSDLRLAGLPPASLADFGGTQDAGSWPQQKGQFALLRIYTAPDGTPSEYDKGNKPLTPRYVLPLATKGLAEGDFVMSLGYFPQSRRELSSFAVQHQLRVTDPLTLDLRREQMDIMEKWMRRDPKLRLKYGERYTADSKMVQELKENLYSLKRLRVVEEKKKREATLQAWISSQPKMNAEWGSLLSQMQRAYTGYATVDRLRYYYRETIGASNLHKVLQCADTLRTVSTSSLPSNDDLLLFVVKEIEQAFMTMDHRVEQELFYYNVETFLREVPKQYWGTYLQETMQRFHGDIFMLVSYFWSHSIFSSPQAFRNHITRSGTVMLTDILHDPMCRLFNSDMENIFQRQEMLAVGTVPLSTYEQQYRGLLYQMCLAQGETPYPDANASLRLSFGYKGSFQPSDGISLSAYTTAHGYLDRHDSEEISYALPPKVLSTLQSQDWGPWADVRDGSLHVNFLTNLDSPSGSTGAPLLNRDGQLVGLVCDSYRAGAADNLYYHPYYSRTIGVDIRFVLWYLQKYALSTHILGEINIGK
jgi:Peptidase S46.